MRAVDIIIKKRDGGALSREEISFFVAGVTEGTWPEYQASSLLMAIVLRGMTPQETAWLTDAMVKSGIRVDLSGIPGIKVDRGAKPLAGAPSEQVTEGLDGLRERLAEYRALGARFAKWRAVIAIGEDGHTPTRLGLEANAHALARYAALCQEAEIVPSSSRRS